MSKSNRITRRIIFGVIIALLAALLVLLSLDFHFIPKAAIEEYHQDNVHISTDEYDFYLINLPSNFNVKDGYAAGHIAVKRYGFLYHMVEDGTTDYKPLVAENGESVGALYSYKGKNEIYHFIHWFTSATFGETNVKYRSEKITVNDQDVELYLYCYFTTLEPIETMVIKDTNVFIVNK